MPIYDAPPCVPDPSAVLPTAAPPRPRRHGHDGQRRLLPGSARGAWRRPSRAQQGRPAAAWPRPRTTWPCSTTSFELYGRHVDPGALHRHAALATTPWPRRADAIKVAESSTPSPPSAARPRPPPTRTSWPACTCCASAAATRSTYAEYRPGRPLPVGDLPPPDTLAQRGVRLRHRPSCTARRHLGRRPGLASPGSRTFVVVSDDQEPPGHRAPPAHEAADAARWPSGPSAVDTRA